MNQLISGAVQLLDEAAKRKSKPKTIENYDQSEQSLMKFDNHNHPHYKEWERIVQTHPDFHTFEDHRRDTRSTDRGMGSGSLVTERHAIDEFGNTLGVYTVPHSSGYIDPPVKFKPKSPRRRNK